MKQQVNLYLPEFRKEKDRLSFAGMVTIVVAFAFLLLLATGAEYFGNYRVSLEVAELEADLDAARDRTNAIIDSYGVQTEDQQLLEEVRRLEENLRGKRALLSFLEGRDMGNTDGFSEYLADLSRFHVSGLRLSSISLRNGGDSVMLGGQVNRAENVPLYLQNLRNGESYNGKNFQTLRIANATDADALDTIMNFDVATTNAGAR